MWKPSLWKSLTILFSNLIYKIIKQQEKLSLVTLGLLHLGDAGAAVLVRSGAVDGAVVDAVVVFPVGVDRRAVLTLFNILLRQPLTLHVSLDPEVGEENKEESSVHPDKVDDCGELVVATVHEVILGGVK